MMNMSLTSSNRVRPHNKFMLDFYKFKESLYEYNYTLDKVLQKTERYLQEYVLCKDSTMGNELLYQRDQDSIWGMAVYEFLIKYCEGEYKTSFGLQCFCGIFEHKVLMKKRFDFLKENGIFISEKDYAILGEIIREAELVKNMHLVCSMKQDHTMLLKCVSRIRRMRELEGELLLGAAKKIKEGFYY